MKYVLLLRAPAEDGPDRYEAAFEEKGYVPLSVPVLETVLVHVDALRDKIVRGPEAQGLSGVIMTSKRSVEAWCGAIRSIPPLAETIQGVSCATVCLHGLIHLSGLADGPVLCRWGRDGGSRVADPHRVPVHGAPRTCGAPGSRGCGGGDGRAACGVHFGGGLRGTTVVVSDGGQESGDTSGDARCRGYCAGDARGVRHDGVVDVSGRSAGCVGTVTHA